MFNRGNEDLNIKSIEQTKLNLPVSATFNIPMSIPSKYTNLKCDRKVSFKE